jgi:hypothetical protein
MAEFKVWSNERGDRLYIRIAGFFEGAEFDRLLAALSAELSTMQSTFDVVTDYSSFLPASPKGAEGMRSGAELLKRRGRRRAVRVTGSILGGLLQYERIVGDVFPDDDDTVRYAGSMAEADALLDNWE